MRITELFESAETRKPGEYVYHATLPKNLPNIARQGLRPSQGYMGPGVYFAYEPDEGYYHLSAKDAVILRTSWQSLGKLFGYYSKETPNGIQRDNDQILVPGTVPSNLIQVYKNGEWQRL